MSSPTSHLESQSTKNTKRSLIAAIIVDMIYCWTKFAPKKVESLGISLENESGTHFLIFLTVVTALLTITFAVHGWIDHYASQLSVLEADTPFVSSRENEGREKKSGEKSNVLSLAEQRYAQDENDYRLMLIKKREHMKQLLYIKWFFEYWVFLLGGVFAVVSLLLKIL